MVCGLCEVDGNLTGKGVLTLSIERAPPFH
jgi:hypothetical protein